MTTQSGTEFQALLDSTLSEARVLASVAAFLESQSWVVYRDEAPIDIPKGVELRLLSRQFVKADHGGVYMGDHLEADVMVGLKRRDDAEHPELDELFLSAEYCYMRLYFDLAGQLLSDEIIEQSDLH